MDLGLKNKTALVTGGTHGIGLATAIALAQEDCQVVVCGRQSTRFRDHVAGIIVADLPIGFQQADVTNLQDVQALMQAVKAVDILVNNVGGGGRWGNKFLDTPDQTWRDVMDKNLISSVALTRLALPWMEQQKWGRVITVSSIYGKEAGGRPWFNAAKSAQISFMKTLARDPEYAQAGITFNTVCPGHIDTYDPGDKRVEQAVHETYQNCPMNRMGTPQEVAALIAFLCSQQGGYINGACITVDGAESKSF